MAKRTHTILIDDLDGSEAAETVWFGLDGVVYEMELSEHNANQLRDSLVKYTERARRTGRIKLVRRTPSPNGESGSEQRRAVREWAAAQGITLNVRGRIPDSVYEDYARAHAEG